MAICAFCEGEMLTVSTCMSMPITVAGKGMFQPVPYDAAECEGRRCHDCNVADGAIHHVGCDMEICPACGGQLISCDCPFVEDMNYVPN